MAYTSAIEGGFGTSASVILADSAHEGILVPDAELLFLGEFHRAGPDLVLTGKDGHRHIVPGYFSSEKHPALLAPNGASLSPDLVDLLAGSPTPGEYAQAHPTAPPDAIGKVEKVVGNVTVMRNGVAVVLHVGDAVFKSDVIQTGAASSCGISFPDGTALNLIANTRMALNDYSYDANGTSNDALFSLVEGTFAFVAGKVAHTGGMKIVTPVATMGIRGTTGYVQEVATITATIGNGTYSFAVVDDFGSTGHGQYDLIDQNGDVIATVSQTGTITLVTPQGPNGQPLVQVSPMSAAQIAFEQQIIQQVFQTLNLSTNPQSPSSPGSSTPQNEQNNFQHLLQENNGTQQTISISTGQSGAAAGSATINFPATDVTEIVKWIGGYGNLWSTLADWSDLAVPLSSSLVEILMPVKVTIDIAAVAGGLGIASGATLNIVSGGSLTVSTEIQNIGLIQINSSGGDPTLAIDGTVYLLDGGQIKMMGATAQNLIIGIAGTNATLINVDNTIIGSGTIGQGDGNLTLVNGSEGTIEASPLVSGDSGILIVDTAVNNSGLMEAAAGGTLQIEYSVNNIGLIEAVTGGVVEIENSTVVNFGGMIEAVGGQVRLSGATVEGGMLLATGTGASVLLSSVTMTGVTVEVGAYDTLTLSGIDSIAGTVPSNADAVHDFSIANDNPNGVWTYLAAGTQLSTAVNGSTAGGTFASGVLYWTNNEAAPNFAAIEQNPTNSTIPLGTTEQVKPGYLNLDPQSLANVAVQFTAPAAGIYVIAGSFVGDDTSEQAHAVQILDDGFVIFTGTISSSSQTTSFNLTEALNAGDTIDFVVDTGSSSNSGDLGTGLTATVSTGGPAQMTNAGTINITGTTTLGLLNLNNTGGTVTLEGAAALNLTGATINGGTINDGTVASGATITISGSSKIAGTGSAGAALNNGGVTVDANQTLTLDDVTVTGTTFTDTASGAILSVDTGDTLNLNGVVVDGGTLDIASGATLNLDNSQIVGVTLNDLGTINVSGTSTIDTFASVFGGQTTIASGQTLVLNDALVFGTVTDHGTISVTGNSEIESATVSGDGDVTINGVTLTLDNDTVSGVTFLDGASGSILAVDGGDTLTLSGVSISGGTIEGTDATTTGTIIAASDIEVTGTSTISGAAISDGDVTVASGVTLTLDDDTVTGVSITDNATTSIIKIDGGDTLTLSGVSISGGTIDGTDATTTGTIIAASDIEVTGTSTISGAAISDGDVTVASGVKLTLDDDTVTGVSITDNATTSIIKIDGGDTLTLSGVSISGGTIEGTDATTTGTIIAASDIEVTGPTTISGAAINNGNVTINGVTLTLDGDTVSGVTFLDGASGSILSVDNTDTLSLSNVTVNGGTINDGTVAGTSGGSITIAGTSKIENAALNDGQVTVASGVTLTLDGDTVTGTTFTDTATGSVLPILSVDNTDTLSLSNVTVNGGTINDGTVAGTSGGSITIAGTSKIENAALNDGQVTVASGVTLTLDGDTVTGTTFTDTATGSVLPILSVDNTDTLSLSNVTVNGGTINDGTVAGTSGGSITIAGTSKIENAALNDGQVTVASGVTLTLDGDTVTGTTFTDTATGSVLPILSVDNTDTLSLSNVTVNGGTINDGTVAGTSGGSITIAGTSKIENAALNDGQVTVASGVTLTLDGDTVTGTTFTDTATGSVLPILSVDNTDTLSLSNVTVNGGTINDGTVAGTSGGSITIAGTSKIENAALNDGQVTVASGVTLTLDGDTVTGTTFTDTATGSVLPILSVDNTDTLSLSNVTVNGGTINDGTVAGTSGGSITIAGTSKIENAALNDGQVTVASGVTLTLDGDTVTGTTFTDTATGSVLPILSVDNTDTLSLSNVTVNGGTINDGTVAGTSGGSITIAGTSKIENAALNDGQVTVASGVTLTLDDDTVTGVSITDNATTSIIKIDGGDTLTLSGVSISGGTIDGTDATTTGTIIAASDIEVTGTSTISGAAISDGDVTVASGVKLTLDDDTVTGTTFTDTATGSVLPILSVDNTDTLSLSNVTVNGGTINDGTVAGTSGGSITIAGTSKIENAALNDGQVTVASGVTLTLDDDTVTGTTFTDTNATTSIIKIDGGDTLTLSGVSISGGTINGTDATTGGVVASDIDVTGPTTISGAAINNGDVTVASGVTLTLDGDTVTGVSITDTNADTLTIKSTVTLNGATISSGSIDDQGTIVVGSSDAPSTIDVNTATVESGAYVQADGGTLSIAGDVLNEPASANQTAGMITASGAHSAVDFSGDASGNTITNGGVIEADSGGTLGFNSVTVDNGYKIELNGAAGSPATMTIGGTVTFEAIIVPGSPSTIDAGSITLSDSSENSIISNGSAATLINAGNTISGAGTIGDGSTDNYLTLDNQQYGVIDATGTNPLILNTGSNTITNAGTLEATDGGTLDIDSSVANSGGDIAAGAESSVAVTSETVTDGEISAAGTGATVKLDNATIAAGTVTTGNATSSSGGVIEVVATGGANLSVLASADVIGNDAVSVPAGTPWNDSGIALTAGEEITITASGVVSFGGADTDPPTGVPGQTAGAGFIAPGLPNQSLVGEIGSGTPFEIGAGTTFIAPTSGELYLSIDDDNFGDNSGSWSASITVTQPLTNTGFVQIDSGANLELQGLIDNQGTIDVTAGPDPANLEIGATVTLCGGGSVTLDGTTASIVAATAGSVLDNDETISGAGTIGDGSVNLTLDNESGGTIDATGLITINTGTNTVINAGTLEATGGGTLDIDSAVDNTGTITANGGTVDVAGAVTDTGPATISNSGVLEFQSSVASTQTVTFDDATGTLKLDDPADVHATVSGLVVGDIIDLTNTTVTTAVWNGTTLTLNGTATAFTISSLPTDDTFAFQSDGHGHGGTDLAVEQQVETVGSSQAVGVEGNPIQLHFTDALTSAGSTEGATLTSFTISEIPTGATLDDASHDTFTITNGSVTLNATELADGALSSLAITPANDTNFTLSAIAAATDPAGYEYTVPATEAVTVDPLTPNVTWNGVAADTLTATEGTFTLHLLADSANSLSGDSGNSIQSVVLTGLAAGDSITDGTVNDTVTSTGTGETIDVSSWNLTNPLSVTTVNDTNFTLTATVTEQDADNPAQTSVATATEAVTVDPLTPNVTWNGVAADTLTATEGTFTLHLLADSANSLSGDSGNSIQSVVLTGLAAGDSITDGTVNDTVTSTGTGETIDVSSWNLTNPLSVTTVNDTNFTLTATVTEQDADNPAQTSVATATEAVTVDPLTPNVTWNGVAADTLTATEGTFTLHLLADSANSLSGDSGNSIQSVVLTGLAAGDSITDGTVNDTVTSTGTGETIDVSSWNLTNPLSVTTVNDTNFTLTATVTEQDADNPAQTSVATATEAVTVDPLTPNVTWNGVAADTLTATEGTFTLHLLADSANSLSGDSGNSIQSVVLTGLAAGDSITDGTVNDTVTSTGTGETIDVSSWNLTNPLSVTTVNDTNFTLTATVTEQDADNPAQTSVATATEAVTVDPLTPNVTWNGVAADTLTATEGTFTLHLLADSANSLSGDSGNSIQSVVLTGLAAGDSITDGTVNDTVTSTGTGETIDVSSWNLTNPLSVTTVNDTNFTLTATVTEQDADNPAQTSVATATEAVTVDPLTPNVTWNGVAADTLTATEGTFTLHLLADSANSLSGDSGNSIQSVVLTGLAAGDSITDGTVNDTVTSTGTGETIDVSSWNLTNPLSVTTVNDTNFTLTATVTEQDADNPAQTSVATATEAVTVDPLTPNVTWNGVAADTLTATEGTFTLHLLADSANSLSGDSGNSIQSVVLTGLAAGDSITDGTVNDTVTSTGTGETIDVSSWNLTNPLSVTTVNDTNFTLTATVTEQDADNPAQTSVATATEAVTVDPLTPNVTWNGVAADTLTATEGTFTLHLLADSANSLSGDSGNSIQSVVLTGLAAGDSITDGTVNDTVTSTGTGETIDVSSWNLTNPLSVTTVNDTNFTLTATVTEQDADNPAQTSVATATEAVTVDPLTPNVTWNGVAADTLTATEGTFTLHLLADSANSLSGDSGNSIQSVVLTGLAAGDSITDGTVNDTVTSTGTGETIDVSSWNLTNPLSVTTVNDTNFTLTATVTEQDADNPAQTSVATATEAVTVDPLTPNVTWNGVAADTLTATEGTFTLHLLADSANSLSGDSGNSIQSVVLTGLAAGDSITDGTVNDTVTSTGTGETIDVSSWNLTNPLSVTTVNDTNFTLTATVTEQDADNPAQTSVATATEAVTVADAPLTAGGLTVVAATPTIGDFFTLNDPAAQPVAHGINDSGQVVGYDVGQQSFLYSGGPDGSYTVLQVPNPPSIETFAYGINNAGEVVGYYEDGSAGNHGFLYSGGTYTTLDVPGGAHTQAVDINNSGQIVGSYLDGTTSAGFLDSGGTYTTLNDPSATNGTIAQGINDAGQIVGYYSDGGGTHGFLYSGGTYTTLNDPNATNGTIAAGINDAGQIVGQYSDGTGTHGFIYSNGSWTTIDAPSASQTLAFAINNSGAIAGYYSDQQGFFTGPEPGPVEGAPAQLDATFTDGNPGDHPADFTATINWGDNTSSTGTISYDSSTSSASEYSVAGSHTYAAGGNYNVSVTVDDQGGQSTTITGTAAVADSIANNATFEVSAPSGDTVVFAGGTGTLQLDNPSTFTGEIAGFTGTAPDADDSDEVELAGVWTTTSPLTGSGENLVVNLTDGAKTATLTFDDFSGSLSITNNGSDTSIFTNNGSDTSIFDPPAANGAKGSVSIGGPGHDHFVFQPGIGADTIANFNSQAETTGFDHFANVQNLQQLAAAITPDALGDPLSEHGHHDGVPLPGASGSYFQAHLQSLAHLN